MTHPATLSRSLAASCAAVMAFHGLLHEMIGPLLFPWAPAVFGPFLWHGMGFAVLGLGLLSWAGTVDLLRFPVVPVSIAIACLGLGAVVFMATTRGEFHFFALCLALVSVATALFHHRAAPRS